MISARAVRNALETDWTYIDSASGSQPAVSPPLRHGLFYAQFRRDLFGKVCRVFHMRPAPLKKHKHRETWPRLVITRPDIAAFILDLEDH